MVKMLALSLVLLSVFVVSEVNGQGRLLALPNAELCEKRPKEFQFTNINAKGKPEVHNYYFSWTQAKALGKASHQKVDWLEARNDCRERCMDLMGIETEAENDMLLSFFRNYKQDRNPKNKFQYIWTSGRLCDFTGCSDRTDLHPVEVFGWFWSNTNTKMAPTNSTPPHWAYQPWSNTGHTGVPQPDNAEFDINQTRESCMGVLNDVYQDGIKWHDIACYHKKPYICEDSTLLLNYIRAVNSTVKL